MIFRGSIPHPVQSLCTLRNHCRQWPRNTRYQADATPYLGRTFTGWIAPALCWRTYSITSFARAIMYELAGELRELIKHFKNQRLRTTVERLAEWMLRSDQDAGGTGHFVIPYGKRVLASHLGMAPENLSRNLASLAPLGVAVRGRHVSLSDRAALAHFARAERS